MPFVEPLVTQLVLNGVLSRAGRTEGPRRAEIFFIVVAGVFAVAGVVGLLCALDIFLARRLSPELAALATAGCALAGSLSSAFGASLLAGRRKTRHRHGFEEAEATALHALGIATQELEELIADNPRASLALAALSGFLATEKIRPRQH